MTPFAIANALLGPFLPGFAPAFAPCFVRIGPALASLVSPFMPVQPDGSV